MIRCIDLVGIACALCILGGGYYGLARLGLATLADTAALQPQMIARIVH